MKDQMTHAESISLIAEQYNEIESLRQQLAESQAREAVLRDAFHAYIDEHEECTDADGWMAMICPMDAHHVADEALAQPSDTSALDAMIQKACDVVQGRCADVVMALVQLPENDNCWVQLHGAQSAIRALPGVTLEDLQK